METIKIRQTISLVILCFYFSIKTFSLFGFESIRSTTSTKINISQKFLYLIDSGHGYYGEKCSGKAITEGDGSCFYEWKYNWQIRYYLAHMLDSVGIQYTFVNTNISTDISITERAKIANEIESPIPKVYISIHGNAASKKSKNRKKANGFEVYSPEQHKIIGDAYEYKKRGSDSLATWMAQELKKEFPEHVLRTEGSKLYREASFTVITKTKCFSILTENEFFTNPNIRKKMKTDKFKKRVAKAHFKFIQRLEKK